MQSKFIYEATWKISRWKLQRYLKNAKDLADEYFGRYEVLCKCYNKRVSKTTDESEGVNQ